MKGLKVFAIILAYLIICLSIMDGPRYVSCKHIDVCEFFDIPGELTNILKMEFDLSFFSRAQDTFLVMLDTFMDRWVWIFHFVIAYICLMSLKFPLEFGKRCHILRPSDKRTLPLRNDMVLAENLKVVRISVIIS